MSLNHMIPRILMFWATIKSTGFIGTHDMDHWIIFSKKIRIASPQPNVSSRACQRLHRSSRFAENFELWAPLSAPDIVSDYFWWLFITTIATCAHTTDFRISAADLFRVVRGLRCRLTTLGILRCSRNNRSDCQRFHQISNDMLISPSMCTKGRHSSMFTILEATANRTLGSLWNKAVLHLLQSTPASIELATPRILSHTIRASSITLYS